MATKLRDSLKGVTNRNLGSCYKYLDKYFSGDLPRRSRYEQWELDIFDELWTVHPKTGEEAVAMLMERVEQQYGKQMWRTPAAYLGKWTRLKRYKYQAI